MKLYREVLISSTEQAEALPHGSILQVTCTINLDPTEFIEATAFKAGDVWWSDGKVIAASELINWTALVPIEVEEEFGAEMHWFPDSPADKTMTGRARDRENAEWQRDHNPHLATGRVMTRLSTPWEEA